MPEKTTQAYETVEREVTYRECTHTGCRTTSPVDADGEIPDDVEEADVGDATVVELIDGYSVCTECLTEHNDEIDADSTDVTAEKWGAKATVEQVERPNMGVTIDRSTFTIGRESSDEVDQKQRGAWYTITLPIVIIPFALINGIYPSEDDYERAFLDGVLAVLLMLGVYTLIVIQLST